MFQSYEDSQFNAYSEQITAQEQFEGWVEEMEDLATEEIEFLMSPLPEEKLNEFGDNIPFQ